MSVQQGSSLTSILKTCSEQKSNVALVKFVNELKKRDIDADRFRKIELEALLEQFEAEADWLKNLPNEQLTTDRELLLKDLRAKWQKAELELRQMPSYHQIGSKDAEPERQLARVAFMLNDVAKFLNIGKNIQPAQMNETALIVLDEAKGLTLEDLAVMFLHAKKGEYGAVYDRLDGQVVLGWLKKYKDARQQRIMLKNQNLGTANRSSKHRNNERALGKALQFNAMIDLINLK